MEAKTQGYEGLCPLSPEMLAGLIINCFGRERQRFKGEGVFEAAVIPPHPLPKNSDGA